MAYRKKLIEVALPLEAINVASAREKSIRHGHPSTLHLWWARRPLAAARAVIFSSLVDDPDSADALPAFVEACRQLPKGPNATINDTPRMRLFDFIERLVQWESTTNEAILTTARELINIATEGNPPPLLDPFAGGGSIPLEAQRLGLEAHASDLNPVPVMINKALIEIPPKFANTPPVNPRDRQRMSSSEGWKSATGLAADVRYYGEWLCEQAWKKIGHFYPEGPNGEKVIAWIWARTVKCPNPTCGATMPLIASFDLSKRGNNRAWVEPVVSNDRKRIRFEVRHGKGEPLPPSKMGRGAKFRCLVCGETTTEQYIKDEGASKHIGTQMVAIVTDGRGGRNYCSPTEEHERVAKEALPEWHPTGDLANNPRHMSPPLYGMTSFDELFTPRQLLALTTLSDLIREVSKQVYRDASEAGLVTDNFSLQEHGCGAKAYAEAIAIYLAFAVDKVADRSSSVTQWATNREHAKNVFVRQAISMVWDFAESNVFSDSSGNFMGGIETIFSILDVLITDPQGEVKQQDATEPIQHFEQLLISTDPPYYDNVPYADLSDFFYIWLRRNLRDFDSGIFGTMLVPKAAELVADPVRFGNRETANKHFETGLRNAFSQMYEATSSDYPLTVYYAFKQSDVDDEDEDASSNDQPITSTGWETMLEGLIKAQFAIQGTWPMRTELARRTRNLSSNALASSIVLVCRPRRDDAPTISRRQFVDLLRKELPSALKEMQSGNIAPVDLAQASIGPGMGIYSRYKAVLEPDGKPLAVRVALGLINQELDAYLAEQDGDIDSDTRFAVSWFDQFGFNEGEFGLADVLARAKNTSVRGVEESGVVQSGRGKVKLVHWKEYDPGAYDPKTDKRATVWEATHHLIERLSSHGEAGAAMLLDKMKSEIAGEARNLAYRLYSICERKGWADHARDYNTLVIQWPSIAEQAAEIRKAADENRATQQDRLFDV